MSLRLGIRVLAVALAATAALGDDAGTAAAPAPDRAAAAYADGDFETARALWLEAARGGDATAQLWLGRLSLLGQGTEQDPARAELWFLDAAGSGQRDACDYLGIGKGRGNAGLKRLRRAANRGDVVAQYYLATRLPDADEAVDWLRRAADAGIAAAQLRLGKMYLLGSPVAPDPERAESWLTSAAAHGLAEAHFLLGRIDEEQRTDLVAAARDYLSAAELGHVMAQMRVGLMYQQGDGLPPDAVRAYLWFAVVETHGDPLSAQMCGTLKRLLAEEMGDAEIREAESLARAWGEANR